MIRIFREGQRVALKPHLDAWMRGARYGTVAKITRNGVRVQLEVAGREVGRPVLFRNPADDLETL